MYVSKLAAVIGVVGLFACGGGRQAASAGAQSGSTADASTPPVNMAVPSCIRRMIDSTQRVEPALQITEVRRYRYNGATVYLVGAPCCDQFNSLYDSACNYLFAPSGGFTGKGDRSHPDFFTVATEDSLIWKKDK
jgi:hypothetical protein